MKHQKNKHRRDVLLGNLLYLKAGYMWDSWARHINEKVSPPLYEPFVIMEGIGAIAYRLKMPKETKIQAIFHVRKLKKTVPTVYQPPPLVVALTEEWELQPEIHDAIYLHCNKSESTEGLVKWRDCSNCDNFRATFEALQQPFPLFPLKDKVKATRGVLTDTK
jgi:hypothetical protein